MSVKLYVASPFGFSEAGRDFYASKLLPELRRASVDILDPWALTDPRRIDAVSQMPYGEAKRAAWRKLNADIAQSNQDAIDRADGLFACLDGTDVDSGTAAEVGYGYAKGKTIVGYRGDFRLAADNEGSIVNLQVEHFIRASGGTIVTRLEDIAGALRASFGLR
jgi:nucleoside 2-deoxyribosyltransferase